MIFFRCGAQNREYPAPELRWPEHLNLIAVAKQIHHEFLVVRIRYLQQVATVVQPFAGLVFVPHLL